MREMKKLLAVGNLRTIEKLYARYSLFRKRLRDTIPYEDAYQSDGYVLLTC